MTIDANDPRPPYQQVVDDLRHKIESGEQYGPGTRLPSVRQLAKDYNISPQTVQSALRELRHQGLVVSQQGRAFFVRDPDRPIVAADGNDLQERLEQVEAQVRALQARVAALEGGDG